VTVTTRPGESEVAEPPVPADEPTVAGEEPRTLARYDLFERVLHWTVAVAFVALLLSGLALAYPRMAWLSGLFGGGQTMRVAHPWIGLVFTAGLVLMLVIWARGMLLDRADRLWFRRIGEYVRKGHVAVDSGRWNGGQKAYFWLSLVAAVLLLVSGIPLWDTDLAGAGVRQLSRLSHNVLFLVMVAGFIVHVLLSVFLFTGTLEGMASGRVTRAWAAWHHPRWFREQTGGDGDGDRDGRDGGGAGEPDGSASLVPPGSATGEPAASTLQGTIGDEPGSGDRGPAPS
jgi:formate dehydrogenase subunit gamma